jgi:hypothetical protein
VLRRDLQQLGGAPEPGGGDRVAAVVEAHVRERQRGAGRRRGVALRGVGRVRALERLGDAVVVPSPACGLGEDLEFGGGELAAGIRGAQHLVRPAPVTWRCVTVGVSAHGGCEDGTGRVACAVPGEKPAGVTP